MKLAPIALNAQQIVQLEQAAAHGKHSRERRRAQAVLSQHRGLSLQQLAAAYAVGRDTVRLWLTQFEVGGVAALAEGARSGRPRKLAAQAQKK
jgi:transposase